MKKLNFIETLAGSFYNPEVYRDVVTNKKGTTFGYLGLLVVLCSIPLMFALINGVDNFLKNDGKYIIDQVPEITFSHGIATMDQESPYYIKSKAGEILFVIDLSDSAAISELQGSAKVLLTKNKLIAQQKENETRTYDLSQIQSFTLNAQKIYNWLGYAWVVYLFIFVLMLIFFYIYRLIQALVNGVIGLILSAILKVNLEYISLLYIAMVAITPVAILASVIWATGIDIPAKGWLGFILALGYISFGIMANKPQAVDAETENYRMDRDENATPV
jgi:hypothetical protein